MITRYNYKWKAPDLISTPVKVEWELVTIIEPISFNEDKTIKEYKEIQKYVKHETLWADFIKSYDLGTISEQVLNHITKGTPLVTSDSLPAGDYTPKSILKGAEIVREMKAKGITLAMLEDAFKASIKAAEEKVSEEKVDPSSAEGEEK